MNTFNISLEIDKSSPLSPEGIAIRQGDVNGTTLIATIYDHGTKLATTGLTPYLVMELPDHEHSYSQAGTYSNGVVTVIINEKQAASVSGVVENAYIELRQSSTVIASTESFRVVIRPDARADKEIGETYSSEIEAAIEELETAIAQAETQIEADVAEWLDQHPEATTTVQDGSITYQKLHSSTKQRLNNKLHRAITAPVVTASDAYAAPPVALVVDGKSVQDGTPTPDAPVAIQSVESVGLAAHGANLLPPAFESRTAVGITVTQNVDGSVHISGTSTAEMRSYCKPDNNQRMYNLLLPNTTYTLSVDEQMPSGCMVELAYYLDATYSGTVVRMHNRSAITFTTPDASLYDNVRIYLKVDSGKTLDVTVLLQLEYGSTATPYQPYVGSTTAIPLDGHALRSLPDGTHDELRVDSDGAVTLVQRVQRLYFDGSDMSRWSVAGSYASTGGGFYQYNNTSYGPVVLITTQNMMSNTMGVTSLSASVDNTGSIGLSNTPASIRLRFEESTAEQTVSRLQSWLSGHPLEILLPLATPQEIPLGTVMLPALPAPDLTAWASCTPATEIELDYERSVTIAVERLEAAIAELATN